MVKKERSAFKYVQTEFLFCNALNYRLYYEGDLFPLYYNKKVNKNRNRVFLDYITLKIEKKLRLSEFDLSFLSKKHVKLLLY